jgi:hypothetical protein
MSFCVTVVTVAPFVENQYEDILLCVTFFKIKMKWKIEKGREEKENIANKERKLWTVT